MDRRLTCHRPGAVTATARAGNPVAAGPLPVRLRRRGRPTRGRLRAPVPPRGRPRRAHTA
jgi:hypothetical protein